MEIRKSTWVIGVIITLLIIFGTYLYHWVEGWSYLDSIYFLVITATTIGFGDFAPQTDLGKIITIFYSFIGLVVVFYVVSLISHYVFEKKVKTRITNIEERREETKKKKGQSRKKRKKS